MKTNFTGQKCPKCGNDILSIGGTEFCATKACNYKPEQKYFTVTFRSGTRHNLIAPTKSSAAARMSDIHDPVVAVDEISKSEYWEDVSAKTPGNFGENEEDMDHA